MPQAQRDKIAAALRRPIPDIKECADCRHEFPADGFPKRTSGRPNSYCYSCDRRRSAERSRRYWAAHPELMPARSAANRVITLRRSYGMTVQEYAEMHRAQGGCCAICGTDDPGKGHKNLAVDHCHGTGRIRGLLCHKCNRAIGLLREDPVVLERAIRYLERHRS